MKREETIEAMADAPSKGQRPNIAGLFNLPSGPASAIIGLLVVLHFTSTVLGQQASIRSTSRKSGVESSSTTNDTEATEIRNPRIRELLRDKDFLGNSKAVQAEPTPLQPVEQMKAAAKSNRSSAILTRNPSGRYTIERANFEQSEPESAPDDNASTQNVSRHALSTIEQTNEQPIASNTSAKTPVATPASAPAYLDLTGNTLRQNTNEKGIGEHGAELSIEASPQQVLFRAAAWIVIALCLFTLVALGIRKWKRAKGLLPSSNAANRVLETLSLGPGRAVSLVEIAGHRAFVAFDTGGIKQLVLAPRSFEEDLNLRDSDESEHTDQSEDEKAAVSWQRD